MSTEIETHNRFWRNPEKPLQIRVNGVILKPSSGSAITLDGDANIVLDCDGRNKLAPKSNGNSGMYVRDGNTIAITSQTRSGFYAVAKDELYEEASGTAGIGGYKIGCGNCNTRKCTYYRDWRL